MTESPYRVFGGGVAPMLGRQRLFARLCRHLTKETPDHVCVVGPKKFGKSVLLDHLARHFADPGEHYITSLYWDLRHGTPKTDAEFQQGFANRVKRVLVPVQPDLAEWLDLVDAPLRELLNLVLEEMECRGVRFLAVLDGFDHVLAGSGITRNLWDEMRTLGQKKSFRLVTGSRRRLRELCKTEESRTSDFWEIFYDTPLEVGCFEDDDWDAFLAPFASRGVELDQSARKEIYNWTGGVPILAVALAAQLLSGVREGVSLSKLDVDRTADAMPDERRELLATLWDDCGNQLRFDLTVLADGYLPPSRLPDARRRDLELRGFARMSRKGLMSSCRLMALYARQQAPGLESLKELFGKREGFDGNIRSLLELRLAQTTVADPELLGYIEMAIRDLHPNPVYSVNWARSITERALDLIWDAELGANRHVPVAWKSGVVRNLDDGGQLSRKRGRQCALLREITGTAEHAPVSRFVRKPTYLLVDHLQSVGNFGQHKGKDTVSLTAAAAFCLSAISLCESLADDLATPRLIAAQERV